MNIQKKILVVEDEKSLRGAVVDFLGSKNFIPLEAVNGKEGVEMALKHHPDLILLDLMMPEMDGMTALAKIREDEWGAHVPVIILTNLSASKEHSALGASESLSVQYVIKSDWKLQDIVKMIEGILEAPHTV